MSLHLQINIFGTQLHIDTILNFRISAHWCKGATTCVYQSTIKLRYIIPVNPGIGQSCSIYVSRTAAGFNLKINVNRIDIHI